MKRRGFLGALASAAGAFALDPERALWVPGAKLVSIPRPALPVSGVALSRQLQSDYGANVRISRLYVLPRDPYTELLPDFRFERLGDVVNDANGAGIYRVSWRECGIDVPRDCEISPQ